MKQKRRNSARVHRDKGKKRADQLFNNLGLLGVGPLFFLYSKTCKGCPHAKINGMQRKANSSAGNNLRQEMNRGAREMREAGVPRKARNKVMKKNYKYFKSLDANFD